MTSARRHVTPIKIKKKKSSFYFCSKARSFLPKVIGISFHLNFTCLQFLPREPERRESGNRTASLREEGGIVFQKCSVHKKLF